MMSGKKKENGNKKKMIGKLKKNPENIRILRLFHGENMEKSRNFGVEAF